MNVHKKGKNMEPKILPLVVPPIRSYQYHAFQLSIVLNHQSSSEWFYNNYIQLRCYNKDQVAKHGLCLDFIHLSPLYNPLLYTQKIYFSFLQALKNDILEFLIEAINDNFYIITFIDEFYIPERSSYKVSHRIHDVLIHGYDIEKKIFYISGFNQNRIYTISQVSFDNMVLSFIYAERDDERRNTIYLHKIKEEVTRKLDLGSIICYLEDYLNGVNTTERHRLIKEPESSQMMEYGTNVYESILYYIKFPACNLT